MKTKRKGVIKKRRLLFLLRLELLLQFLRVHAQAVFPHYLPEALSARHKRIQLLGRKLEQILFLRDFPCALARRQFAQYFRNRRLRDFPFGEKREQAGKLLLGNFFRRNPLPAQARERLEQGRCDNGGLGARFSVNPFEQRQLFRKGKPFRHLLAQRSEEHTSELQSQSN